MPRSRSASAAVQMASSSGTSEPAFLRTRPICRYLLILSTPDFTGEPGPVSRVVEDVTCLGCGCACDDIRIRSENGGIQEAERACVLGAAWFGDGSAPATATVDLRPAAMEA